MYVSTWLGTELQPHSKGEGKVEEGQGQGQGQGQGPHESSFRTRLRCQLVDMLSNTHDSIELDGSDSFGNDGGGLSPIVAVQILSGNILVLF